MKSKIIHADVLDGLATLPDQSVQSVVTSPPYWALRDYGNPGQIGLEPTPQEFLHKMVAVFRDVRRVLRHDGTAWVNMGDGYNSVPGGHYPGGSFDRPSREKQRIKGLPRAAGLKPKDLIGMPWRLALALQDDGWWLRSDIIWHKPNPMPESVTDRPTKSHEYIFLLTKAAQYYYDADAIREAPDKEYGEKPDDHEGKKYNWGTETGRMNSREKWSNPAGRNKRTVWTIPTAPYPGAHYATFPPALPETCIKAGTSEKGACPECGSPWERVVDIDYIPAGGRGKNEKTLTIEAKKQIQAPGPQGYKHGRANKKVTTGWKPTCDHSDPNLTGCTVLDPFNGHGTTGLVAARLGRSYIGIEINHADCIASAQRIEDDNPMFNKVRIIAPPFNEVRTIAPQKSVNA